MKIEKKCLNNCSLITDLEIYESVIFWKIFTSFKLLLSSKFFTFFHSIILLANCSAVKCFYAFYCVDLISLEFEYYVVCEGFEKREKIRIGHFEIFCLLSKEKKDFDGVEKLFENIFLIQDLLYIRDFFCNYRSTPAQSTHLEV